ncbi:MAG: peroxiredoxin [Nitrospirae bacterium]|nr:peroxiredoxin [Nitrospirota bacterium]
MIKEGMKAPDFCLLGVDENAEVREFCLSDLFKDGKRLILYFYPKDNTPGCTTEACDFRDNLNRWSSVCTVVGVSPDSITSHKKFREKQGLNFPLLSDVDNKVSKEYDAWGEKVMCGKTSIGIIRTTYLIGPDGVVQKMWRNVKAKGHVEKVLQVL